MIEKSDTSGSYLELGMGPYSFTNQTLAPEHAIRFINESGNIEDSTFLTDPGNPFNITWRHEYGQKCLKANSMYDLCDTGDRFYFVIGEFTPDYFYCELEFLVQQELYFHFNPILCFNLTTSLGQNSGINCKGKY